MNWLKTLRRSTKKAEIRAKKAGVTLKPRHFRKLKEIWADKYLAANNYSLTALLEVRYAGPMQEMYLAESPFLRLMKHDNDFTSKNMYAVPIILGEEHGIKNG